MRRPSPPEPAELARQLRRLADVLQEDGPRALDTARALAARGYPATTGSARTSRGSSGTSSTEKAALDAGPADQTYDDLRKLLRLLWYAEMELDATLTRLVGRPTREDNSAAGSTCERCGVLCRPTAGRPHNRIVSGYCPACKTGWYRYRASNAQASRSDYNNTFKKS